LSGKLTVCDIENGPVEIVDLPIENSDFPQSCKRLLLVNPSEKYEFVSWDDEIPNIWKNNPNVPSHQPVWVVDYCFVPFSAAPRPGCRWRTDGLGRFEDSMLRAGTTLGSSTGIRMDSGFCGK